MINIDEFSAELKALTRAPRDAKYASMFGWHGVNSELLVSWAGLEGYALALMQSHKTDGQPAQQDQDAVVETKPLEKEVLHPSQKSQRRTSTKHAS
jgi:hypothetical protein